jgi:hypothetical protein
VELIFRGSTISKYVINGCTGEIPLEEADGCSVEILPTYGSSSFFRTLDTVPHPEPANPFSHLVLKV